MEKSKLFKMSKEIKRSIKQVLTLLGLTRVEVEVTYAPEHKVFVWTATSDVGRFTGSLTVQDEATVYEVVQLVKNQVALGAGMRAVPEGPFLAAALQLHGAFGHLDFTTAGVVAAGMAVLGEGLKDLVDEDPVKSLKRLRKAPSTADLLSGIAKRVEPVMDQMRQRALDNVKKQLEQKRDLPVQVPQ